MAGTESGGGRMAHHLKDLAVELADRPGTVASLGEALGKAGVNIDGISGVQAGGKGTVHILGEDVAGARKALEGSGTTPPGETDVVVRRMQHPPGDVGKLTGQIAEAG